jgi:hypothetical protein
MNDIDPRAAAVQLELLRRATPERRAAIMLKLSSSVISLSRSALRARHPEWSDDEIGLEWVRLNYGEALAAGARAALAARGRGMEALHEAGDSKPGDRAP